MRILLGVLTLFCCLSSAASAEVFGIQAVLLHCWDIKSVQAAETAIGGASPTVTKFVVSSAPFLTIPGCSGTPSERLANIDTLINFLTGTGIEAHVIVYLGGLQDDSVNPELADNFLSLWNKIISRHTSDLVRFIVGASLEDKYTAAEGASAFKTLMKKALSQQPGEDPTAYSDRVTALNAMAAANRLRFVRGPVPASTPARPALSTIRINGIRNVKSVTGIDIDVLNEFHSSDPKYLDKFDSKLKKWVNGSAVSGYQIWSNDGPLVYGSSREQCSNCDALGPRQSVKAFGSAADSKQIVYRLLWRPTFNLFTVADLEYTKPAKSASRSDSGQAFDNCSDAKDFTKCREQSSLRAFLSSQ